MGARGPKPTAAKKLKLRGSKLAKRPASETAAPSAAPGLDCPPELTGDAAAEWARSSTLLAAAGRNQPSDRGMLAVYCEAWGEFAWMTRRLAALLAVTADRDAVAETVLKLIRLKNAAADRVIRAGSHFGFSPAARASRIDTSADDNAAKKDDPLAALAKRAADIRGRPVPLPTA